MLQTNLRMASPATAFIISNLTDNLAHNLRPYPPVVLVLICYPNPVEGGQRIQKKGKFGDEAIRYFPAAGSGGFEAASSAVS